MEKTRYRSLNNYFRVRFGCKVYKLALNAGFSCPNRDGKLGTGGCIFCSEGGSGEFAGDAKASISEQLEFGKNLIKNKLPRQEEVKYMAYFQAFTNTYAPIEILREKYGEAIDDPDVVAISIATRPDCLPEDVLDLLYELNREKPIFVELGLQTSNENTAKYIRRGYPLAVYDKAVFDLKERNINVVTHVILGLPGETKEDMLNTVRHVSKVNSDGIKLQLLHVLKGTDLALAYANGEFEVLTMEEYIDTVEDCLKIIPPNMVVQRLTGDGDKKLLIAPMWSADKKRVISEMNKRFLPY